MAKSNKEKKLNLPCSFGTVSAGKKTSRVGITVQRGDMPLGAADKTLCERRLTLCIKASGNGDQVGQARLPGMEDDLVLEGSADVKGFSVHADTLSFGLTFNRQSLRESVANGGDRLDDFASREGSIHIIGTEALPEDDDTEDETEPPEEGEE